MGFIASWALAFSFNLSMRMTLIADDADHRQLLLGPLCDVFELHEQRQEWHTYNPS
jgi:hypothetical protein